MPQEHDQARSYHEALRRLGVQNPERVRLGTPVQFTADVDDLSHLVAPVSVPVVVFGANTGAFGAGTFSGLELVAGARTKGVFITLVQERSGATASCYVGIPAGVALVRRVLDRPLLCRTGPVPESVLHEVTFDSAPEGGGSISSSDIIPTELLIAPGESFFIIGTTANVNRNYSISFREIPVTGPVEP